MNVGSGLLSLKSAWNYFTVQKLLLSSSLQLAHSTGSGRTDLVTSPHNGKRPNFFMVTLFDQIRKQNREKSKTFNVQLIQLQRKKRKYENMLYHRKLWSNQDSDINLFHERDDQEYCHVIDHHIVFTSMLLSCKISDVKIFFWCKVKCLWLEHQLLGTLLF